MEGSIHVLVRPVIIFVSDPDIQCAFKRDVNDIFFTEVVIDAFRCQWIISQGNGVFVANGIAEEHLK